MSVFDAFFSMFSQDIGIDLGTANTLVWVRGKGVAIREPSVIARHKKTKQTIAIGTEAKKMVGKTPATIETVRPLRGGVISDFDAAVHMIAYYIGIVHQTSGGWVKSFIHPKVVIGIPSAVTEVQRRAVWEAALSAGAREAYLIEEPMAAAIGADVSVFAPTGVMVVDVGGGTTEIAVISLGGIVVSRSLKTAGDDMNEAIIHYIRLKHGLLLGIATAEDVKIKIGTAYGSKVKSQSRSHRDQKSIPISSGSKVNPDLIGIKTSEEKLDISESEEIGEKMAIVRGRDIETGLPKSLRVTEAEVREAISPVLAEIIEEIRDVLEESPPELTSDILEHGILLTGGGALLPGFDRLIVASTKIPVLIADDPLTTVVRGCGKVLEDITLLHRVKVTGGLQ